MASFRARSISKCLFTLGAASLTASAAVAQLPNYSGLGFVEPLADYSTEDAVAVGLARVMPDHLPEALHLFANGDLIVNESAGELGRGYAAATGITAMAVVTADGVPDEVILTDGTALMSLAFGIQGFSTTVLAPASGGHRLSTARLGTGDSVPGLVSLQDNGATTRLGIFQRTAGNWSPVCEIMSSTAQGTIHEALVADWDGNDLDDIVLLTDRGLEITPLANPGVFTVISGTPDKARIALIPSNETSLGRDYIAWHRTLVFGGPESLVTINAHHEVALGHTGNGRPKLHVVTGFDPNGSYSLVLLRDAQREAIVFHGLAVTGITQSILTAQLTISLEQPPSGPVLPPATGLVSSGDYDADGDTDLVFVDNYNQAAFIPSPRINATELGMGIKFDDFKIVSGGTAYEYQLTASPHEDITHFYYEVYQQFGDDPVPEAPVHSAIRQVPLPGSSFTMVLDGPLVPPPVGVGEIEWIVFRPFKQDAQGNQTWFPGAVRSTGDDYAFPWLPVTSGDTGGGPGGTAIRPKICPQLP